MVSCRDIRASLAESFDAGLPPTDDAVVHAADCPGCRAYLERLRAVESVLRELPIEAPSPTLIPRVTRAPEAYRRRRAVRFTAGGTVAGLVALAGAAGWWFPGAGSLDRLWAYAVSWMPESGWITPEAEVLSVLPDWMTAGQDTLEAAMSSVPAPGVWLLLVSAVLAWTLFNVYCASRMRGRPAA